MSLFKLFCRERWLNSYPLLRGYLLLVLILVLLAPGTGGDSQVYHLPNIINILRSGSLADFQPEHLYRPAAITTYYPRGFEAVCSLFYLLPASRPLIILFKSGVFFSFYLLLVRHSGSRTVSLALLVFLSSMDFLRADLGDLKNDLMMAVPLVWAASMASAPAENKKAFWLIPLCCSAAMSMKASAIMYSAPVVLIWLWTFRRKWRMQLAAIFGIIVSFGLFFYWADWMKLGSPVYPFAVNLGSLVLAPGRPGHLLQTCILANLDQGFLPAFARGLLRAAGPAGALGLLMAGAWVIISTRTSLAHGVKAVWRMRRSERGCSGPCATAVGTKPEGLIAAALMTCWLLVFLITPFSDHNGTDVHNQLFSGGTIRMALPVVLLTVWAVSRPLTGWAGRSEARKRLVIWTVIVAALVNLTWYDVASVIIKPENAFIAQAPVAQSFDNRILAVWVAGTGAVCALAVMIRRRWLYGMLIAGAIAVQQAGYPKSLGYTSRFKQIGRSSAAFEFLETQRIGNRDCVAVYSADESSFFLACVNDYLLPRAGRMFFAETLDRSRDADWLIVCAKDAFDYRDNVYGREYRVSWSFLNEQDVPSGFRLVFDDEFYRIFLRKSVCIAR
jgi:hypothetical protein